MMHKYRGIACEKKATYTVFITENGEFLRGIPLNADVQIGEKAEFHLMASATPKRRIKPIFIAPALIAAILLLFLVASWFPKTTTAYAHIQVKGDSTIEIGVDEEGNVMSLHSTTEILGDWQGQPIDLVLAKAVEQVSTDNKELAVTTVYEKEDKPKLKKQIEQAVQEVKKEKPSPQKKKNSFEPIPKDVQPKEEKIKPPGQIKKEEKLPNPNKPATNKEQKNPPNTEKPVNNNKTKDQSKDNKAQPTKENKPTNNSDKVPGQEKKRNEDKSQNKSNNGNKANKNNGNNNGNGNNKNSNN